MPDPIILSNLREQVASLQVLSCRLLHERVVVEDGVARRRSQGIGLEPLLVRIGLCSKQVRSRQLSCAHTLARDVFARAIATSEQQGVVSGEEANRWRDDLQRISHAIHSTDWAKSAAEIRYAQLQEQEAADGGAAASLQDIQWQLNELADRHQASVEELRRMHQQLLARIDSALSSA